MAKKATYLDVMLDGRFICQLRYDRNGEMRRIDGKVVEMHNEDDIKAFVEEKRPTLKGKNFNICFTKCLTR